jgi:hypothetical protein
MVSGNPGGCGFCGADYLSCFGQKEKEIRGHKT